MKVLLASPYGFVPEIIYPEYQFLDCLQNGVNELHVLRTGKQPRIFPGRSILHQNPLDVTEDVILSNCIRFERNLGLRFPDFAYHDMNQFFESSDLEELDEYLKTNPLRADLGDFGKLKVDGLNLGECAIFLALRRTMLGDLSEMDEQTRQSFQFQLEACFLGLKLIKRLWKQEGGFDGLVLSHFNYPLSKLTYRYCKLMNPNLHFQLLTTPNLMGQKVGFRATVFEQSRSSLDDYFETWSRNQPFPILKSNKVKRHFQFMFEGKSRKGYSKAVSSRAGQFFDDWGWNRSNATFIAYLSGSQERFSAELSGCESRGSYLFETQLEWVEHLVNLFKDKSAQLVIRMHPREFLKEKPTKLATDLIEIAKGFPVNIRLNIPEDNVSSYDLMQHARAVLVSWSTTTVEASLLGVPVLGYMKDHDTYPMWDLGVIPESKEEYLSLLESWTEDPPEHSLKYSIQTVRWFSYFINLGHMDFEQNLNYKPWVYGQWTDRYCRLFSKLLDKDYNPMVFLSKERVRESEAVQKSFETGESLENCLIKALPKQIEDDTEDHQLVKTMLTDLSRLLFSIPAAYRIRVVSRGEQAVPGPGEYLFVLGASSEESSVASSVRYVSESEHLLKFFCEEVFC